MPPRNQRPSDQEIARIERKMRFETWSAITVMIAVTVGVVTAFAIQLGVPRKFAPVILIAIVVGILATFTWVIAHFRTERAFARIETGPTPRQSRWIYVVAIGSGLLGGLVYWRFPENGRWFSYLLFVGGIVAFIVVQVRLRRPPSGK